MPSATTRGEGPQGPAARAAWCDPGAACGNPPPSCSPARASSSKSGSVDPHELLITTDTNLRYQQNLRSCSFAILVLTTTGWSRIRQVITDIQAAVAAIQEGDYREIPIP
jgi:hypothetical protein